MIRLGVSHKRRKFSLPVRGSNVREAVKPLENRERVTKKTRKRK